MPAPLTASDRPRLFLLDGTALAYRAHFALRAGAPLATPEGQPTGAIYGFTMTLRRILEQEKPDRVAVAFDAAGTDVPPPARTPSYKATREKMPEELVAQLECDPRRRARRTASRSSRSRASRPTT